jgi:hypothetical protein
VVITGEGRLDEAACFDLERPDFFENFRCIHS